MHNIMEGHVRYTPDLEPEPALANEWELIEPTVWRFKLRVRVDFHNGNPFTADAALLSGELDLIFPAPLQDIEWISATPGYNVMRSAELRTLMMGFEMGNDELHISDLEDANPLKAQRVR